MTNYFKIYLKSRKGRMIKEIAKTPEEVIKILKRGKKMHYEKYYVVKRVKNRADVPMASGYFSDECQVVEVEVEDLNVDYRIVGHQVVIYDKYIQAKKEKNIRREKENEM